MISGLIALTLLSFVMISPLRIHILEKWFKGLGHLYHWHHRLSVIFLGMVLVHIAIEIKPYFELTNSLVELLPLFFDPEDPLLLSGTLSLGFFALTTFLGSLKTLHHQPWKWLHRSFLLGYLALLVHVFWLTSSNSWSLYTVIEIILLFFPALLLFVFYWAPEKLSLATQFRVKAISHINERMVHLTLELPEKLQNWVSGSFGFFSFECRGACGVSRESHPFTVFDIDQERNLHIIIKALGDDTKRLQQIEVGTPGKITGPHGDFLSLAGVNNPQLWLAGGIGVAPFIGLLNNPNFCSNQTSSIVLVLFTKGPPTTLFTEQLTRFAQSRPWFRYQLIDDSKASITLSQLIELCSDLAQREIAISGPPAMIGFWKKAFNSHGFRNLSIHTEEFL